MKEDGLDATVRLEHQLVAVESDGQVHAMLELDFAEPPGDGARPPLHLALVIDRSGSMHGAKLEAAKSCAELLVRRLAASDRFALVTYDHEVQLVAGLGEPHPDHLIAAIAAIQPGGSTNLSGGWLKGLEEVGRGDDEHATRRVLLLTDGLANDGIVDPARLVRVASQAAANGSVTTTIGFGEGFDEDLLSAIADGAGGNAYYADTPEAAPGIFATEFEGLANLVAQNVSVEIRPAEEVVGLGVLNDYPATLLADGIQLALGDAWGGERRRVVFGLSVPKLAELGTVKIADVVVRWVAVGERLEAHERTIPVMVNVVPGAEAAGAAPDHGVTEEIVRLEASIADREARRLADGGDVEGAVSKLRLAAVRLTDLAPRASDPDGLRTLAANLLQSAAALEQEGYTSDLRKTMTYRSRDTSRRRS